MQVGRVTFHCDTDTVDLGGFPAAKNYSLLQLQAFWDLVFPKPLTEDTNKWNWNFIGGKRDVSVNIDSSHRKLETITKTKGSNLESPLDLSKQLKTNVLFSNRFMSIPRLQQWNVHLTFWLGAKKAEEFITGRAFPQTEVYLISYQMSALFGIWVPETLPTFHMRTNSEKYLVGSRATVSKMDGSLKLHPGKEKAFILTSQWWPNDRKQNQWFKGLQFWNIRQGRYWIIIHGFCQQSGGMKRIIK